MPAKQGDARRKILDTGRRIMSRKGFSATGTSEILTAAGVPKGSFYHYFGSKDAFGEAMMQAYFADYIAEMEHIFAEPKRTAADRLMAYWRDWHETQSLDDCQGKCLAVKLGAEVADLSESMRLALKDGTSEIIDRIENTIAEGLKDGSISIAGDSRDTAELLYDMWLGASVMAKIRRDIGPLDTTMKATRHLLHISTRRDETPATNR
ncbi:TetR/AcrR family transcriptional regulator [Paramicrobacterium chengjingii]|uniref:TetR/AcrR family transcriptional regulator n=1 Tax=Paramicrobacterium chengjingii TaxID=2769067 RepID=A0ABX6YKP2_9MICO|nr:TetR/AcrR family transcriptional regulator [Microbacterium chengjingii]QPZ39336.1 TetR/AcrR family transcriptional regulator [Microbacterium chengjingii]